MPAIRAVVRGRVQGVGYRAYVMDLGGRLGLNGEVWNRRDGGVEATACHEDEDTLNRFVALLHNGPGLVDHVVVDRLEDADIAGGFFVGPSR